MSRYGDGVSVVDVLEDEVLLVVDVVDTKADDVVDSANELDWPSMDS